MDIKGTDLSREVSDDKNLCQIDHAGRDKLQELQYAPGRLPIEESYGMAHR